MAELTEKTFNRKRIAFLGGAFDPPHPGHAMLARKVLALGVTDLVLWVPSWAPPHKVAGRMSDFAHRFAMTKIVAGKIPGSEVSDIEARKCFDPSYSYKVLDALQKEYPDAELQLLIGQDSLEQLHTWYCARDLAEKYTVLAFPRKTDSGKTERLQLPEDFWGECLTEKLKKSLISAEFVEISSTDLRKELAKRANVRHIIDADVFDYIERHGLYR